MKFSSIFSKSLQILLLILLWDPNIYLTKPNSFCKCFCQQPKIGYISISVFKSLVIPTSWIRLLVKILFFISCHRKSKRILENIFCPRSILSSPNTLFLQKIPFSNKLQGSTILYLTISIDLSNNCLQIFPVNLATITENLLFCDLFKLTEIFWKLSSWLIISIC